MINFENKWEQYFSSLEMIERFEANEYYGIIRVRSTFNWLDQKYYLVEA